MNNSILNDVKKLIGPALENVFDDDLIIYINTVIDILAQLGIKGAEGFAITDENSKWSDFLPSDKLFSMAKTFVIKKAQLFFDPPQSGPAIENIKSLLAELEWRIREKAEDYYV